MAIQDEMYKRIVDELSKTVESGKEKAQVDIEKAKVVAKL